MKTDRTLIERIADWYHRQSTRIEDGDYRCIPVPNTEADDVINHDQDGNLGYWLCEVLYRVLGPDHEAVEAQWQAITGILD